MPIEPGHDVSPDGQRILFAIPLSESNPQPVMLVQNWTADLHTKR